VKKQAERRYTAKATCFAASMTYSDLNYREHEGLLKRLSMPRKPNKRKTYGFDDVVVLAMMQHLVNIGIGQRDALSWALIARDEAQRWGWGRVGSLELRLYDEHQDVRFTNLPGDATPPAPGENIMIVIRADHIAAKVAAKLGIEAEPGTPAETAQDIRRKIDEAFARYKETGSEDDKRAILKIMAELPFRPTAPRPDEPAPEIGSAPDPTVRPAPENEASERARH
jgi:hypothetical protein